MERKCVFSTFVNCQKKPNLLNGTPTADVSIQFDKIQFKKVEKSSSRLLHYSKRQRFTSFLLLTSSQHNSVPVQKVFRKWLVERSLTLKRNNMVTLQLLPNKKMQILLLSNEIDTWQDQPDEKQEFVIFGQAFSDSPIWAHTYQIERIAESFHLVYKPSESNNWRFWREIPNSESGTPALHLVLGLCMTLHDIWKWMRTGIVTMIQIAYSKDNNGQRCTTLRT